MYYVLSIYNVLYIDTCKHDQGEIIDDDDDVESYIELGLPGSQDQPVTEQIIGDGSYDNDIGQNVDFDDSHVNIVLLEIFSRCLVSGNDLVLLGLQRWP